jgi:iron complex outermembrane recepter protein
MSRTRPRPGTPHARTALHMAAAAAIGVLSCGVVWAQTAPSPAPTSAPAEAEASGLESVVVTAQRREEKAQTVPIAMSAFSATELARRNITDALSLTQYVPNLVAANNTGLGTANTYYIRGIGDGESLASKDPPVGTYIDDIYFSRQSANNFAFFDVERVEVLRGPQGTLFGRNTTGGAVNVHLKKPATTRQGYIEAGFGKFGQTSLRGGIDLPASDALLTKLSAYYGADDGYVKNTTTGETLNDRTNYGARLGVRARAATFTWDGFATYMHAAGSNLVNFECDPAAPSNCNGRYATTGLLKANNGASQYPALVLGNGKANLPLGNETNTQIIGSNFSIPLGDAKLNLITGYVDTRQKYNLDFFDGRAAPGYTFVVDPATGRPSGYNIAANVSAGGVVRGRPGGFAIAAIAKSDQFTQEAKLTGSVFDGFVSYVGGFFYLKEKNYSDFADISTGTAAAAAPPAAAFPVTLLADRILRNSTDTWAAYAQFDFNFTDQLKLTAGARFTTEKKEYNFSDNRPQCQTTPVLPTCIDNANFINVDNDLNPATPAINIPRDQSIKIWTPRLAVDYQLTDDAMVYASATRGFKSGGQSARSTAVRLLLPFSAETVWSYELGARSEWFNRRLRANVTAFTATTKNLQGGSAFVTTNLTTGAQTLSFVTRNFANLENKGIEFDITAVPVKGLNLTVSGGYQDAKYKIDPNRTDFYGTVSTFAQQRECQAALAGLASPRGDTRLATARAQSSCGNGVVTPTGDIAKPIRTPKWTVSGGVAYDIPVSGLGATITPSVNFAYMGAHEVGSANVSIWRSASGVLNSVRDGEFVTGSYSAAHTVINAGVAFRTDDKLWSGSIDCSNCTNEAFPQASLSNFTYLNPPMTWSVKVKRAF